MSEQLFKVCSRCSIKKSIEEFAKNQYGKNNRIVRRAYCKECGLKKTKINPAQKKAFLKIYPRPDIGDSFTCPICKRYFKLVRRAEVSLDHDDSSGKPRGWLCNSCNTSLGKFGDDIETLQRASDWIKNGGL